MMQSPPPGLSKAQCVYPAYLNKKKTVGEGRRIPKNLSCENPLCSEIKAVCEAAGLKTFGEESKVYPREIYKCDVTFRGRVRVVLKNPDGSPVNERFPNKKALLMYIAEMIPKLKSRSQKGGAGSSSNQPQQGGGNQSKGNKGNKKKKGRR